VTSIGFTLARDEIVDLAVYDLAGRREATLARGLRERGRHLVSWQGRDDRGWAAASGVYLVRLCAGHIVQERKITLVQ